MKIEKLLLIALMANLTISCGGQSSKKSQSESESVEQTTKTVESKLTVDVVLKDADELLGKEIELEGVCTHLCRHGAKKMFLMGSDDKNIIRIESGKLGAFDQKAVNSVVEVKGTLVEQRIDEAYLQAWEARVASAGKEEHGESEGGCSTEKKARGEGGNTTSERITDFRKKIAERKAQEGKDYLSFYHIAASSYEIK